MSDAEERLLGESLEPVDLESDTEMVSDSSLRPLMSNEAVADTANESSESAVVSNNEGGNDGGLIDNATDANPVKVIDPVLKQYQEACQAGDLNTVKQLIESHAISIDSDFDPLERVTGLHWASINNRLDVVKYLVSLGADANFKSNNLSATPLHWAARYGYVHIVDHLLRCAHADATLCDDQGFNTLHLAVNSSNIMLVCYVLFFVVSTGKLDVDCRDQHGRTSLLWGAYQGDSLTVALLLKFGANVKALDDTGFTPLHWGVVKGQPHVLKSLIKEGQADVFQETLDGKNCFKIATEMNTKASLTSALIYAGYDKDGYNIKRYLKDESIAKIIIFTVPFVVLGLVLGFFAHLNPLFAILITAVMLLATRKSLIKFILPSFINSNHSMNNITLMKSPLIAGIFYGSLLWVTIIWFLRLFTVMLSENIFLTVLFSVIAITVHFLFFQLINSDPGYIESETDHEAIRSNIQTLLEIGKFDTRHFCIETWIRKPLRSKFSSFSQQVIMRFDHFCPWINNDVGLFNHKKFLFFVVLVQIGIFIFIHSCLELFDTLDDDNLNCFLLGDDELCAGFQQETFIFNFICWCILQSIWVTVLICIQGFQLIKGVTTYEFNVLAKENKQRNVQFNTISFNNDFSSTPAEFNNNSTSDSDRRNENTSMTEENNPVSANPLNKRFKLGCCGICFKMIGLEQWILVIKETIGMESLDGTRIKRISIPTNYGIMTNIKDFFLISDTSAPIWLRFIKSPINSRALLNGKEVDYKKLYDYPEKTIPPTEMV